MAGLLHDIGKTRIPKDILVKPGKLTDAEREVMNRHPVDGARLILKSEQSLDLAAVVAYEHHIMIDGTGYPHFRYGRACHLASRLVHVCDVFDALRTDRPYRQAWPLQKTLAYIEERAGTEFDADIVRGFVAMMNEWDSRIAVLTSEQSSIPTDAVA
jgi:putative two-component system response regulator